MDPRGKEVFASKWKELYKILHLRTKDLSLKKMCPFCKGKFIMRCLTVSTFFGAIGSEHDSKIQGCQEQRKKTCFIINNKLKLFKI